MSAEFDQTHFAHLWKGAIAATAGGTVKGVAVGRAVRSVPDSAITSDQTEPTIKGARRVRLGQRTHYVLKHQPHRFDTQAFSPFAQARTRWRFFLHSQASRIFEKLTDRQLGKDDHGQDQPKHDLIRQRTGTSST